MRAVLAWLDDAGRARRRAVAGELTLGRGPESDVRLAPRNVSRRHARLVEADGELWVEDLGSRNGTWLNGVRVEGRAAVRPGDEVRLADEVVRVEAAEEETLDPGATAATPPPLPGRRGTPAAEPPDATAAMAAPPPQAAPRGWRAALAALRTLARRRA